MVSYTIDGVEIKIDYYNGALDIEILDHPLRKAYHQIFYSDDSIFINELSPMCNCGSTYRFLIEAFKTDVSHVDVVIEQVNVENNFPRYDITLCLNLTCQKFTKLLTIPYACELVAYERVAPMLPDISPYPYKVPSTPPPTPCDCEEDVSEKDVSDDDFSDADVSQTHCDTRNVQSPPRSPVYYPEKSVDYVEDDLQDTSSILTDPDMPHVAECSTPHTPFVETDPLDDMIANFGSVKERLGKCEDDLNTLREDSMTVRELAKQRDEMTENINTSNNYILRRIDLIISEQNSKFDVMHTEIDKIRNFLLIMNETMAKCVEFAETTMQVLQKLVHQPSHEYLSPSPDTDNVHQRHGYVGEF